MDQLTVVNEVSHLVFQQGDAVVTDSMTVARAFGKQHKDVLKSITNMQCSEEFTERNFALSSYKDSSGKENKMYYIKRDGLVFLIMGYTGEKAARMKEMYIHEFNRMEQYIKQQQQYKNMSPVQMISVLSQEMLKQDQRLDQIEYKLETQITLHHGEQRRIQNAVAARVYKFTQDQQLRKKCFSDIYRRIKNTYNVGSYRDIKRKDLDSVLTLIQNWTPDIAVVVAP
jgi:Rha family phage regulatory protein